MKRFLMSLLVLVLFGGLAWAGPAWAEGGMKKRRPLPYEYGRVVLNNYSENAKMAPVVFDHWLHRTKFTCRVCHVDLAFAMKAGVTHVKAADNIAGYYCGGCHNGKGLFGAKVFESCVPKADAGSRQNCGRCHSLGKNNIKKYDFATVTAGFPQERFGNGINWEQAEATGLIKPSDYLEGISIKRKSFKVEKDFALSPQVKTMPAIIYSHRKHVVWSGCELCHPEIFVGVKKGMSKYSMADIFDGKNCGTCHTTVAFPMADCQRCHAEPVQPSEPDTMSWTR